MRTLTKESYMTKTTKTTKNIKNTRFAEQHPLFFFGFSLIGMPILTLAGVFACTAAIAYPLALFFGWC